MPRLLLALLAFLPAAAFAIEIPLTQPLIVPAPDTQTQSAAASDGDSYFVIWTDDRTRLRETWGTRVSAAGEILDPTGIPLFEGTMTQPQILWTGSSYLVVWGADGDLWMLRVDRNGNVVDPARAVIAGGTPASIARNESQVVIGYSRGNELHALFVTQDARPIVDLRLAASTNEQHDGPHIAWNGLQFVAIWSSYGGTPRIEGVRFGQGGAIDNAPRVVATGGSFVRPRLASDGANFVLLTLAGDQLFARRISGDLSSAGTEQALPEQLHSDGTIVWTGTHYVVAGSFGAIAYGVRLDAEARLLDASAIEIERSPDNGSAAAPALASNGRDLFVAWTGRLEPATEPWPNVYGSLASPSTLTARTRTVLSRAAQRQSRPTITNGITNLLAIWSESTGLYARRLAMNGAWIDAIPVRITDKEGPAQATFNGTDYIVAWTDSREIRTFRVRRDGPLVANEGSHINAWDGYSLALASNGTTTAIAMSGNAARIALLNPDATFATAPAQLTANVVVGHVDLATGAGGEYLFTWGEMEFLPPTFETAQPRRVMATRLTSSLVNLHPGGGFAVADTSAMEGEPAVTWNGSEWIVVWTEAKSRLRARHIAANGTLSGGDVFVAQNAILPDVAWDGSRYVITWTGVEGRFVSDFHAAWFSRLGTPPIHTRTLGEAEHWPPAPITVTTIAPGVVALGYARLAREPQYGSVTRAFANLTTVPAVRRRAVR
jgi:hypothetical protein